MIKLKQCLESDCETIRQIQKRSFETLLKKYRDYDTNPACETEGRILEKMAQPQTTYYLIQNGDVIIGAARVFRVGEKTMRISPIMILPEHQKSGFGRAAMSLLEETYPEISLWQLDTILQEEALCRFYEGFGYRKTGGSYDIKPGMTIVFYEKTINCKS